MSEACVSSSISPVYLFLLGCCPGPTSGLYDCSVLFSHPYNCILFLQSSPPCSSYSTAYPFPMLKITKVLMQFLLIFQGYKDKFSSVTQSCLTLCDPMDCSTPGFPVHHQLPELAQIHVHRGGDAIQPSHPLSCPIPPTFNLSQHQSESFQMSQFFTSCG